MTWRVRPDGDRNEIAILRGLVDELSIMVETEFANEHHDKSLIEFNEAIQKTIWTANNDSDEKGNPVWWPRHISVGNETHLIEEVMDDDKNVLAKRTKYKY
jgi:hypothetical protein